MTGKTKTTGKKDKLPPSVDAALTNMKESAIQEATNESDQVAAEAEAHAAALDEHIASEKARVQVKEALPGDITLAEGSKGWRFPGDSEERLFITLTASGAMGNVSEIYKTEMEGEPYFVVATTPGKDLPKAAVEELKRTHYDEDEMVPFLGGRAPAPTEEAVTEEGELKEAAKGPPSVVPGAQLPSPTVEATLLSDGLKDLSTEELKSRLAVSYTHQTLPTTPYV